MMAFAPRAKTSAGGWGDGMIGVRLTVPIACWRVGSAREYLETHELPPPATCYGALLSLVGEEERERHRGCRVTAGLLRPEPGTAVVLRTLWRVKDLKTPPGNKENARPDYQQLRIQSDVVVWLDSAGERGEPTLEQRVRAAFRNPEGVERFGGLSLGESTHLINDAWLIDPRPPGPCNAFLLDPAGTLTLPTWVDHVGSAGTLFAVGSLAWIEEAPGAARLPIIG